MGTLSEYEILRIFRQLSFHDQQCVLGYATGRLEGRKEMQEQNKPEKNRLIYFERKPSKTSDS